ncbi:MAG: dephospho-CoA kinase [Bdellovibrionota bacterium]|jgi:dephospho-CoA kinase
MLIGLTGTIGSGKSVVARILESLGCIIIDADLLARDAVAPASPILPDLKALLGNEVFDAEGLLNRKAVAQKVFNDPLLLKRFESIIHPEISRLYQEKLLATFPQAHSKKVPIIYVAPLLFEVGYSKKDFDKIIVVTATKEVCLKRIQERDKSTQEEALARFNSQLPSSEKEALADIVIENNGSLEDLRKRVSEVFFEIKN